MRKNLIAIYEKKNESVIAKKFKKETSKLFSDTNFCKVYRLAADNVGIDNKKEIFAESTLLKLKNLAPVIVIPDLLTPGINDKIWKRPM